MLSRIGRWLLHVFNVLFRFPQWHIGVVDVPITEFLQNKINCPPIQWLPRPAWDRMFADPFAVKFDNKYYLLFENYNRRTKKACISISQIEGEKLSEPKTVISSPHHLSYPYVFAWEGEIYCVPESAQDREVALYRAEPFPDVWKKKAVLLDNFAGVDNTVIRFEGRWWLFCTCKTQSPDVNLYIFYATDLIGPWLPHLNNPVKKDIRCSRPAGTPFIHQSRLYRPVQDSSASYGGRVVINEITELNPNNFSERQITVVVPDPQSPYRHGIHTLSIAGDKTIVDGKTYVYDFLVFRQALAGIIRKVSKHS